MKHGLIVAGSLLALVSSSCNERKALVKEVSRETLVTVTDVICDIPPPATPPARARTVTMRLHDPYFIRLKQPGHNKQGS